MDQSAPYNPPITQNTTYTYKTIQQRTSIFNRHKNLVLCAGLVLWTILTLYAGSVIGSAQPTKLPNGKLASNPTWKLKRLMPGLIVNPALGCKISGCGGGRCISSSSPEMTEISCQPNRYGCFKQALCELQDNGQCGWTKTPEFQTCQEENPDYGDRSIDLNQDIDEILGK